MNLLPLLLLFSTAAAVRLDSGAAESNELGGRLQAERRLVSSIVKEDDQLASSEEQPFQPVVVDETDDDSDYVSQEAQIEGFAMPSFVRRPNGFNAQMMRKLGIFPPGFQLCPQDKYFDEATKSCKECSLCRKGYFMQQSCSRTEDTECIKCSDSTRNDLFFLITCNMLTPVNMDGPDLGNLMRSIHRQQGMRLIERAEKTYEQVADSSSESNEDSKSIFDGVNREMLRFELMRGSRFVEEEPQDSESDSDASDVESLPADYSSSSSTDYESDEELSVEIKKTIHSMRDLGKEKSTEEELDEIEKSMEEMEKEERNGDSDSQSSSDEEAEDDTVVIFPAKEFEFELKSIRAAPRTIDVWNENVEDMKEYDVGPKERMVNVHRLSDLTPFASFLFIVCGILVIIPFIICMRALLVPSPLAIFTPEEEERIKSAYTRLQEEEIIPKAEMV